MSDTVRRAWIEVTVHDTPPPPPAGASGGISPSPDEPARPNGRTRDYATVCWNGVVYTLTRLQRRIVAHLWEAWEAGVPFVDQQTLLEVAESKQQKMSGLFRDSPAWDSLVVFGQDHGGPAGTFCLAPSPTTNIAA